MRISDWSSDVCSSDLRLERAPPAPCRPAWRGASEPPARTQMGCSLAGQPRAQDHARRTTWPRHHVPTFAGLAVAHLLKSRVLLTPVSQSARSRSLVEPQAKRTRVNGEPS